MAVLLYWGFRTLPAERWQMIAAVPVSKDSDGTWQGLNLTFYGFFSASATVFGVFLSLLLLASLRMSLGVLLVLVAGVLGFCVPASRTIAALVEGKKNTFTIAGAAFMGVLVLPPAIWLAGRFMPPAMSLDLQPLPLLGALSIAYPMAESIGRLACLSFGCCYGLPIRRSTPWLARMFKSYHVIFHGSTKKAAYAAGLEEEPLIPVQALTSFVFALSGLAGLSFFLTQHWRAALIVPAVGTWSWRAVAELLRADYRGSTRVSAYQVMSMIAVVYITGAAFVFPGTAQSPDLVYGFTALSSPLIIVLLQLLWVALFFYYGRSRVTASKLRFHVVSSQI